MNKFYLSCFLLMFSLITKATSYSSNMSWPLWTPVSSYWGMEDDLSQEYYPVSTIAFKIDGLVYIIIDADHPEGKRDFADWESYKSSSHTFECVVIGYSDDAEELSSVEIPQRINVDYSTEYEYLFVPCEDETEEKSERHKDKYWKHGSFPVTGIADEAFSGRANLRSVQLPSTIRSIGGGAFSGCSGISSVNIANVTLIGGGAFDKCSSLTSISLSNNLRYLGSYSFANCVNLSSPIILPSSIVVIGWAFMNCRSLPSVDMSAVHIDYSLLGRDWPIGGFSGCSNLVSVTLPENTTVIGDTCFWRCSSLKSITIPETVEAIKSGSFRGCSSLESITIPENVKVIEPEAFWACSSLESITIPEKVNLYDEREIFHPFNFYGCTNLKKITFNCPIVIWDKDSVQVDEVCLGDAVRHVSATSFINRGQLNTIHVSVSNPFYDSRAGSNAIIDSRSNTLLVGSNQTIIPEGVVAIGDSAFWGRIGLSEIVFPKSLTSIGKCAFNYCTLSSITIPQWIESIGSVWSAFGFCNLKSVIIDTSIVKGWFSVETAASIEEVVLGEHVREIGTGAFLWFKNITSIDIPEGITSIGYAAFSACQALKSILLPSSIEAIGREAFYDCYSLDSIISEIKEPFPLEDLTFDVQRISDWDSDKQDFIVRRDKDYLYKNAILCVPKGTKEKYKTTTGWSRFQHIIEMDTPAKVDGIPSKASSQDVIYDIAGRPQRELHKGLNILQATDGTIRKMLVQ